MSELRTGSSDRAVSLGPPKAWRTGAAMLSLPALVAAAVFANTLGNDLVYDDTLVLERLSALSGASPCVFLGSGRGLTYAVHLLDESLWGSWAPGWHLTNLALHSLASALAAYAAFALTRSRRVALLCGLLFAVHPVHVEAVASAAYRKDILAMIFVSLALALWLGRGWRMLRYAGSILCLGLALLSKEVAVIGLVPMLFLADLLPGSGRSTHLTRRVWRAFLGFLPFLVLGVIATTRFAGDVAEHFTRESIYRTTEGQLSDYNEVLATAAGSVPDVARLLFMPLTLSADYPTQPYKRLADARPSAGVSLVVLWLAATLFLTRRHPVAAFAMAWTLVMYLPCSNIIPLTHFFLAERYLYVPSLGICLLLAIGLDGTLRVAAERAANRLRFGTHAVAALLIAAFGVRSVVRNMDWHDAYALWSSARSAGFETYRIHYNIGHALIEQGRFAEAIEPCRKALRFRANNADPHRDLGAALTQTGKIDEGIRELREALRINPHDGVAHHDLGLALIKSGKIDDAIQSFHESIRINPNSVAAHTNLGVALAEKGKLKEAVAAQTKALRIDPQHPEARFNLAVTLQSQGKFDEAAAQYREVLRMTPDNYKARCNLGFSLFEQGKIDEAIEEYRHARRIKPDEPTIRQALKKALGEQSRRGMD